MFTIADKDRLVVLCRCYNLYLVNALVLQEIMSPFQGSFLMLHLLTQGCTLGYFYRPFRPSFL